MEHDPGTPALLARVRWGNVAKALALAAVVALIAAWPRLRAPDPQIPPGAAVPVRQAPAATPASAPEETVTTAVREPVAQEPDAAPKRRDRPHRKPRSRRRKAPGTQRRQATRAPPRPAPTWRPPAQAPAEFSVE